MRKIAPISLFLLLAIAPTARSQSASFADLEGHWARECVEALATEGVLNGYPDGNFHPDRPVTRAEFATILEATFGEDGEDGGTIAFSDVSEADWAARSVRFAVERGFLAGYPDGRFRPEARLTRAEALVALANGLVSELDDESAGLEANLDAAFVDGDRVPDYARAPLAVTLARGWVTNYPEPDRLEPDRPTDRGDVATFLCRALDLGNVPAAYVARAGAESAEPSESLELRGVWVTNIDSEVLFDRDRATEAIATLAELNFNTLYPTVWNWGYTLYPSAVLEAEIGRAIDPDPRLQGRDLLAEIVEVGAEQGIAVIPWFEFGFMLPADSALARRRSSWLTQRSDGSRTKFEGDHERVWLNPFRPEVQELLLALVAEIVANYDIAGIQFDDHLGLPVDFGYDSYTIALYRQETGNAPPADANDPAWVRWRADKITAFVGRLFETVKAHNSDCLVALSPNPYDFAYTRFLQDWRAWERRGYVEEIVVQVYREGREAFDRELRDPTLQTARDHIPVGVGILAGLKGKGIPMARLAEQVEIARRRGYAGVSFFFYQSLWNWAEEGRSRREEGLRQIFTRPAARPEVGSDDKSETKF